MTHKSTGYLELDDGKLYYEMAGAGEALVLSHAGFVDSGMWDDQWHDFTQRYRVIRYDMRGFGKSDPVTGPRARRNDLYRLLKHLDIERAHLLGCSQGGEIILDLALEHPDMVDALIIVSAVPGGFELQGEPPPQLLEMIGAVQQGDLERASELQIRLWIDGPFRQPEQVDRRVRQRAAAMNRLPVTQNTWAIADMQPLNPLDPPAAQRLHEIQVPTLIVAGALDNPEILRAADVMTAGIESAQKAVIPDSAHLPNMEQPALFNQTVNDFLATLSA
ncbi:MAG TPA: alpha/beta fold hydrolase [Spirillospora sp.]|nr:alpha/beta fold hydrolase [Spirillospora sp.]